MPQRPWAGGVLSSRSHSAHIDPGCDPSDAPSIRATWPGACVESPSVQRGDVRVLKPPTSRGHEQPGRQLGVVVQADDFLPRSLVLIAPTSQSARAASVGPVIEIEDRPTRVLVEMLGAVEVTHLGDLVARLTPEQQAAVDTALMTVLGLG